MSRVHVKTDTCQTCCFHGIICRQLEISSAEDVKSSLRKIRKHDIIKQVESQIWLHIFVGPDLDLNLFRQILLIYM